MPARPFVQLSSSDCQYLIDLIESMDSNITYTAKQRSHTLPKLKDILISPNSRRLGYQDVEYLLELIEDDNLEDSLQQRLMTQNTLENIRELQQTHFEEIMDVASQREVRRNLRLEKR